ncbi:GNAT family N-acetyltransferase [Alloscardovia venturai]|uniref:GNAT family N-acetyltransferase n=1 Tax=Alloscardovia venturai TaxID=1769421 RepID=A0ABW2Y4R7_9BIFI
MYRNIAFRKARRADLPAIMTIVNEAKALLKADGSSQWQDGYPNEYTFIADIDADASFVLTYDDTVVATAMIADGEEAGYSNLIEGQWQYPLEKYGRYAVIHRVAVSAELRGRRVIDELFLQLFYEMKRLGYSCVRIDTHKKNIRMQHAIERAGMTLSGTVTLDHDPIEPTRQCYEGLITDLIKSVEIARIHYQKLTENQ